MGLAQLPLASGDESAVESWECCVGWQVLPLDGPDDAVLGNKVLELQGGDLDQG